MHQAATSLGARRRNSFDARAARERCRAYRRRILDISQQVTALHVAPAFSCVEITDAIYHGLMRRQPDGSYLDGFLMSKGHGCMIQYVILEELGLLTRTDLDLYCQPGGRLGAHPDYGTPGIGASTGSLGHGMGLATFQRNCYGPNVIPFDLMQVGFKCLDLFPKRAKSSILLISYVAGARSCNLGRRRDLIGL